MLMMLKGACNKSKSKTRTTENPMSADRVKWEHIHRVFELCKKCVKLLEDLKCIEERFKEYYEKIPKINQFL